MGCDAVFADAQDHHLLGIERVDFVTEIAGFLRSTGGGVFGVEIEDDLAACKILQRHAFPTV